MKSLSILMIATLLFSFICLLVGMMFYYNSGYAISAYGDIAILFTAWIGCLFSDFKKRWVLWFGIAFITTAYACLVIDKNAATLSAVCHFILFVIALPKTVKKRRSKTGGSKASLGLKANDEQDDEEQEEQDGFKDVLQTVATTAVANAISDTIEKVVEEAEDAQRLDDVDNQEPQDEDVEDDTSSDDDSSDDSSDTDDIP